MRPSRVLLVNYAGYPLSPNIFIPDNSLATLAGVLAAHGHAVEILDYQNPFHVGSVLDREKTGLARQMAASISRGMYPDEETAETYFDLREARQAGFEERCVRELLQKIEAEKFDVVGFKLWAGNGFRGSLRMAEAIRQAYPQVTLVAGGPAVQYAGERIRQKTEAFDFLVEGEGEAALLRIAEGAREGIPRAARNKNLEALPAPTYDPAIYPNVSRYLKLRIIDDSRGCFNRCAFCSHGAFNGVGARKKPVNHVVDEMAWHLEHEGVRHFRLAGSNPPWKFLTAIAGEILVRNLSLEYSAFSSMNNTKAVDFPLLARSGLKSLFFGIESGDPEILRKAHRKSNLGNEHVVQTAQAAMREGIFITLSFIVPSPFETAESLERTFALIERIFRDQKHGSVIVVPPFFAPGSAWWDRPEEFAFRFAPGYDADRYISEALEWDSRFLLPKRMAQDLGVLLGGKTSQDLAGECQKFTERVEGLGIITNLDDAGYMLGRMADMDPFDYKNAILTSLLQGGVRELEDFVAGMNQKAQPHGARRAA